MSDWTAMLGWDGGPEGLLTVGEVAALYRVSPNTVRSWARNGKIPAIRPGGDWRFSRRWVRENRGQQPAP